MNGNATMRIALMDERKMDQLFSKRQAGFSKLIHFLYGGLFGCCCVDRRRLVVKGWAGAEVD